MLTYIFLSDRRTLMVRFVGIVCLLFVPQSMVVVSLAQEQVRRVSLAEAVELFDQHNLELQLARSTAIEWAARALQDRAYPNPSFEVTHEPLSHDGESVSESYFNLNQRLEWQGLRSARIQASLQRAQAARARFQADSLKLLFDVVQAYIEAQSNENTYQQVQAVTEIFRDADTAATAQFAEGELSAYRMRRLRVERARYENRLALVKLDLRRSHRRLAMLLMPEQEDLLLVPTDPVSRPPAPPVLETMLEHARQSRPELIVALADESAAKYTLTGTHKSVVPAPTLTAGYKRQSNGFDGLFLGAQFDLPVFDRKRGDIAANTARLYQAETHRMLVEKTVAQDVRLALESYSSLYERLSVLSDALLADADQLLDAARVAYAEGDMNLVELLDAAEAFFDARRMSNSLLQDALVAYYDLMRATGRMPFD